MPLLLVTVVAVVVMLFVTRGSLSQLARIPVRAWWLLLGAFAIQIALELMATGRRLDAAEALRLGLVNRVVPVGELDSAVDELAETLAAKSPVAMRLGRDSFYRSLDMRADDALDYLQSMLTIMTLSEDTAEGIAAFAEKRAPNWRNR